MTLNEIALKNLNEITFPVYRMYNNELTWVRVESPIRFTEVRKIGSRFELNVFEAKILPDRNHIADLVLNYSGFAVEIPSNVFDKMAELASK